MLASRDFSEQHDVISPFLPMDLSSLLWTLLWIGDVTSSHGDRSYRNALIQPAHQNHVYWTAGVNEVCPKQVASLGDSVIQFWLIQGLEVRGTAGTGTLNTGIGEDGTGPCMKESNRSSLISILYPQRNSVIDFFPPSPRWNRSHPLDAEALLQEMLY